MPFSATKTCTSELWTEIFENVHKPAITGSELGFDCERSNIRPGAFIKDILTMLNQAYVVLADLTDMNSNVFYELGVRHTLKNRTILVSQSVDDLPSDLRQYGVIKYNTGPKGVVEYKENIKSLLKNIEDDPERSDNPVSDYLHLKSIVTDISEAKSIEKKLLALITECSFNLRIVEELIVDQGTEIYNSRFQNVCLNLLISTYYIYPNDKYIDIAHRLYDLLTMLNSQFDVLINENYRSIIKKNLSESTPRLTLVIIDFMKQTSKILIDFRNQNFIEPNELSIIVAEEKHKKFLK